MLRHMGPFGGGFQPLRRPRFGYDGWEGGLGYGSGGRPDTICGHCGGMARPGPCDAGQCGEGLSKPKYMRGGGGGGGDLRPDLAAGSNHFTAASSNGMGVSGGCGPTCSTNYRGIRLKGNVGDHDVDLKLGGKQKCACEEDGGCEASHRKARSRSRSRKKRERRGRRKTRRRGREMEEESSDGDEQNRGRRRERGPLRGGGEQLSDLEPRVDRLEADVERLNNGWHFLKDRIPDLPRFPTRPDLGLPDDAPFELSGYAPRQPEFGGVPMRPRMRRKFRLMDDLEDFHDVEGPPTPGMGLFRPRSNPFPIAVDDIPVNSAFAREDGALSGRPGFGRGRPGLREDDDLGPEFAGLEDPEAEPPVRTARGMRRRTLGRSFRGMRGVFEETRDPTVMGEPPQRRMRPGLRGGRNGDDREQDDRNWGCEFRHP
jgi:hypothetical protein